MRLIIETAKPSDWPLAMRAAKSFLDGEVTKSAIVAFAGGPKYLITRTKTGLSVREEKP